MCERWKKFVNFLDDMGVKPEGMTLERVNNELGYCKENCRWATVVEQQSNKRTNHFLEFSGERMTMTQWAKRLGMKKVTLQTRLRNGWSVERALSEPVGRNRNA